jgi:hypothetical protein
VSRIFSVASTPPNSVVIFMLLIHNQENYYSLIFVKLQMGLYPVAMVLQLDTTHITQNNTPLSNKTQHTKLHKQWTHCSQWKYNYNYNK